MLSNYSKPYMHLFRPGEFSSAYVMMCYALDVLLLAVSSCSSSAMLRTESICTARIDSSVSRWLRKVISLKQTIVRACKLRYILCMRSVCFGVEWGRVEKNGEM